MLSALVVAAVLAQAPGCYRARVLEVVDGDTLRVALAVQVRDELLGVRAVVEVERTVRLAGVRAAESSGAQRELGAAAEELLAGLVDLGSVEVCPLRRRSGRPVETFGRLVAAVCAGGLDVGVELISAGVAVPGTREGLD